MNNIESSTLWDSVIQSNYGTPAIHLVNGSGCEVWDVEGNRYLDFLGGIATNILGHSHPAIIAAVSSQIGYLNHVSNFYSHPQVLKLAKHLQEMTNDSTSRIFFCNSGTEANEAALKLSRLTNRSRIISFKGSFHGRTMGSLSITGQSEKRDPFKPLLKKVKFAEFNDLASVKKLISKKTAMVIIEPIQGEFGVLPTRPGFLQELRKITSDNGTLLAIDAVQTGMGRTGTWFGYEREGIKPDVITLAKGLGGGLPIGAMIAIGPSAKLFQPGSHGSTFGGNPIAAASANTTIDVINDEGMLAKNFAKGEKLKHELARIPGILEVRGSGLLLGVVLKDSSAKDIQQKLLKKMVLVNAANETVIRIAPAYVVTDEQIDEFISKIREVL
jgi:acetylornithine/N-succinyldiaminopimelate aminotransferase